MQKQSARASMPVSCKQCEKGQQDSDQKRLTALSRRPNPVRRKRNQWAFKAAATAKIIVSLNTFCYRIKFLLLLLFLSSSSCGGSEIAATYAGLGQSRPASTSFIAFFSAFFLLLLLLLLNSRLSPCVSHGRNLSSAASVTWSLDGQKTLDCQKNFSLSPSFTH